MFRVGIELNETTLMDGYVLPEMRLEIFKLENMMVKTIVYTRSVMKLGVKFWFYFSPSEAKRR